MKMVVSKSVVMLMAVTVTMLFSGGVMVGVDGLSMDYYMMSCPFAEMTVTDKVTRALQADPTLAAPLLRLHFHDCFVQGCDASVLLDSTKDNTAEKDSPANLSLRGFELIDEIKDELENRCPGVVSCADILAMVARDAIFSAGGPFYPIRTGRRDGRRSKIEDTFNLPAPFLNSTELINLFGKQGFTVQEMVALSGAHTIGVARCSSFKGRLSNFDSTHDTDPSINGNFAKVLSRTCAGGDKAEQPLDPSRNTFDNAYYVALQQRAGVLFSDQSLFSNPRTRPIVNAYAMNEALFALDFQQAMQKMGFLNLKEASAGEVRQNCRTIN